MKKILLASSSDVFLSRNSNLLMQRGIKLYTAKNGAEALGVQAEKLVDLILADCELADMDGSTLCSMVRMADGAGDLPVILVCHNHLESIRRVEKSGASAMLLKPVDPTQLLRTVGDLAGMELVRSKRAALQVRILCKNNTMEFTCFSRDISNTGMLVEAEHELATGSRIACQLILPDSSRITANGEVIRSVISREGKKLYGFKFLALPGACRSAIDSFVSSVVNLPPARYPNGTISHDPS